MPDEGVMLVNDSEVELVCGGDTFEGDAQQFWTYHPQIAQDLKPGEPVLLDDGRLTLEVVSKEGQRVRCRVVSGGKLTSRKGINLPDTDLSLPSLTKDHEDLEFALDQNVDFIALSFVRNRLEIDTLRRRIGSGPNDPGIIAKMKNRKRSQTLKRLFLHQMVSWLRAVTSALNTPSRRSRCCKR